MEIDLKLEAIELKDTPTKTQLENILTDVEKFLTRMSGAMLMKGDHDVTHQPMAMLLNTCVQLKAVKDGFSTGTMAGAVQPNPQSGGYRAVPRQ